MTLKMLRIPPDLSLHGPAAGMRELVQRLGVARKGLPLHTPLQDSSLTALDKPAPSGFFTISFSVYSTSMVQRDVTQRSFPSTAGYQEHILPKVS